MIEAFLGLGLAVLAAVPPLSEPQAAQRPAASDVRTRDVYVSVLDNKDKPVPGLAAADFVVREDGTAREVLRAGRESSGVCGRQETTVHGTNDHVGLLRLSDGGVGTTAWYSARANFARRGETRQPRASPILVTCCVRA